MKTHIAIAAAAALSLAGCASTETKMYVKPEVVERPKLEVPSPAPVQQLGFEWMVITKENAEQKFAEIEKRGGVVTLFALTPQGYQNLSLNVSELRRYIQQQNAVIAAMKKYYEAPQTPAADKPAGQ
jgi:uncharacterized lipoprotein YajG